MTNVDWGAIVAIAKDVWWIISLPLTALVGIGMFYLRSQFPTKAQHDAQTQTLQESIKDLAGSQVAPAAALWRALGEMRAKLAMDLSEAIGRLPSVEKIEPPGNASALLLAQHLAGDDPSAVIGFATDIVRRNRLRHPAVLGPGPIEVLR